MIKSIVNTNYSSTAANWGLLLFRVVISCLMLSHGFPKLQTLLAGGPVTFPDPLGVGNHLSLILAVSAEFFCSLLLILGLGTRLVVIPLIITMLVAVFIIHATDGLGKQELGLIYLISYLLILVLGPGKYSLDQLIQKKI